MKLNIITALLFTTAITACSDSESMSPSTETMQITLKAQTVTVTKEDMTRATLASESLTDLWVLDGSDIICHQTSGDADFGAPTLSLTYGSHDLTVVSSRMSGATISSAGLLTGDSPKATFAHQLTLDVTPSSSTSQTVTLQRQTYQLTIKADDEWPTTFGQFVVTISPDYTSLNVLSLQGLAPSTLYVRTATLPSTFGGTTGATIHYHGFTPSADEYMANVTLTLYAADNQTIIQQHTVNDVPLERNYHTTLHGNIFAKEPQLTVSVDSDFAGEKEVTL